MVNIAGRLNKEYLHYLPFGFFSYDPGSNFGVFISTLL
jgi:hypothetical protein